MSVFVTGTGTDVGKTLICSWLCLHSGWDYFKPVQTGCESGTDSDTLRTLTSARIHPEIYCYAGAFSPHVSAALHGEEILSRKIALPIEKNLIVEGAGGVLVPLNSDVLLIDLIRQLQLPVIVVASSTLGTINHTLLSLEALHHRSIPVLGVIVNGPQNSQNVAAIEKYGQTEILAVFPWLATVNRGALFDISLTDSLKKILEIPRDACSS